MPTLTIILLISFTMVIAIFATCKLLNFEKERVEHLLTVGLVLSIFTTILGLVQCVFYALGVPV